jgi:hypothetical protein
LANFAQDVVLAMFASNAKLNADAIKQQIADFTKQAF